tara:strand:- start:162635 stop:164134 length:1500 start_codon:yes stop_codon:yes gene_type:complete
MQKRLLLGALIMFSTISFGQWEQVGQEIFGENQSDLTGSSTAMNKSGNRVAVYDSFHNGTQIGRIRVFDLENGQWEQVGNDITALVGDGQSDGRVVLNGDGSRVVLAGASHNIHGDYTGAVRVFELHSENWVQLGTTLFGEAAGDLFGTDVAINEAGDILICGAPQAAGPFSNKGYTEIYKFQNGNWQKIGQRIIGLNEDDELGQSVSINSIGTLIAIAAPSNDSMGEDFGQVSIYELVDNSWVQKGNPINGEYVGNAIGINGLGGSAIDFNFDGSKIAIGSIAGNTNGNPHKVRIFNFQGNDWTQIGNSIVGTSENGWFGQSVELNKSGDIVIVGDPFEDDAIQGAVRVYRLLGNSWVQQGNTLQLPSDGTGIAFGWCTAINDLGNRIAVGAPLRQVNSQSLGSVTIYQNDAVLNTLEPVASQFKLYPNPNNGVFNIDFTDAQELVTVNIIDLLGKQVVKIEYFNTKKVEVNENLKAGVYLVEISAANTSETIRIVVE